MLDYEKVADSKKEDVVDESLLVEVTEDKMLGVISFSSPKNGGKELTLSEVNEEIKKAGVISGLNDKLIEELVKNKQHNYKYVIARGKPAVDGEDGKIEFHFDTKSCRDSSLKPKENEDGSVDFKTLDIIKTVKKDELLAEMTLPTEGEPGENVLGQVIRQKAGKRVKLPRGKNVYQSPDKQSLFASIEGQLIFQMNQIDISETYVVKGNAGVATGDIDFVGNILVNGNVESDFTIKAGGNVEVLGFVEGATIEAGNNIVLHHGIQGMNKGKLIAGGNIIAKFIQNSTVEAKGCLHTEAIMHSQVEVDDSVLVEANKGLIVGGTVQATNLISAKIIGSPMSTTTNIQISMTLSLHHKYNETQNELRDKKQKLDQVRKNVKFVHDKIAKGERIPQNRLLQTKKMVTAQKQLQEEIKELQKEYDSLSVILEDYREGVVKVSDVIYPGVKVTMGSQVKYIGTETKYVSLYIADKEIKTDTYS